MHRSGWVGLRRFVDPTHHGESKKIQSNPTHHISPTQPNPTQSTWFGLGRVEPMSLKNFIIIIIIKLSKKNININILKKPKD